MWVSGLSRAGTAWLRVGAVLRPTQNPTDGWVGRFTAPFVPLKLSKNDYTCPMVLLYPLDCVNPVRMTRPDH